MVWKRGLNIETSCVKIQSLAIVLVMLLKRTLSGTDASASGTATSVEACRWETFNATCPSSSVVLIRSASYGRMREGRCLETNYSVGCWKDVLLWVDELCSGRRNCKIDVPNRQLHEMQPCAKDLQTYLEATYECVKVQTGDGVCRDSPIAVDQRSNEGYLSNLITDSTAQGSVSCPWLVKVARGQRINVTLFDFNVISNRKLEDNRCHMYATIRERSRGVERVCGGKERLRKLYLSFSNELQIIMMKTVEKEPRSFLIRYQAVGCPDVQASEYSWTRRDSDHLTIGCNCTGHTWHLVCKETQWIGDFGQCQACQEFQKDVPIYPYGLLFSIVIGVVLGIFLGACLLTILVAWRKRVSSAEETVPYYDEGRVLDKDSNFARTAIPARDPGTTATYSGFINPTHPSEQGSIHASSYALIRDAQVPPPNHVHHGRHEKDGVKTTVKLSQALRPAPVAVGTCYGGHPGGRTAGVTVGWSCDSPMNDSGLQSKMSMSSFASDTPVYNDAASPE